MSAAAARTSPAPRAQPRPGAPKPLRGWVRADQFLADSGAVRAWIAGLGAELGAPSPPVAAALMLKTYTYDVLAPVVTGWAEQRRVADHSAAHVYVRRTATGVQVRPAISLTTVLPGDPLAGQPGVTVAADETGLLAVLRRTLVDNHLGPAVEAVRAIRGGGARPLWGSVAQSLCYPATVARGNDAFADVRALLSVLEPNIAELVEVAEMTENGATRPVLLRRTCCFAYALPGGDLCRTCCLHDETGQDEAFRDAGLTVRRLRPRLTTVDVRPAGASRSVTAGASRGVTAPADAQVG